MSEQKSAVILLSGGLDSVVSIKKSNCLVKLALIFDYGQNAFCEERNAAQKIADYYGFPLKIIKLDWFKDIISNGLTNSKKAFQIKNFDDKNELKKSMESVWIPNRNALFINIAAAFCEAKNYNSVIIGANKEEAEFFKDNSKKFIDNCNELLTTSTNTVVDVVAPLINFSKNEIVKIALDENVPLELIYSCYKGKEKHCGLCESCLHLKNALLYNDREDLIQKIFG